MQDFGARYMNYLKRILVAYHKIHAFKYLRSMLILAQSSPYACKAKMAQCHACFLPQLSDKISQDSCACHSNACFWPQPSFKIVARGIFLQDSCVIMQDPCKDLSNIWYDLHNIKKDTCMLLPATITVY